MSELTKTTIGKRLSRHITTSYQDIEQGMKAFLNWKSFQELVDLEVEKARVYLRSRDLPYHPRISRCRKTGKWMPADQLTFEEMDKACGLDHYVLKLAGFERDSSEHLAARFIVAEMDMRSEDRSRALEAAFQLGQISILSIAYAAEKNQTSKAGRAPKRRVWADTLAAQITSWEKIPNERDPLELQGVNVEYTIYRDGENVVCNIEDNNGRRESSLTRSTFEKTYLRPTLKNRG